MPPAGLLLGQVDFANLFTVLREGAAAGPYSSLAAAKTAGAVTLNYGLFVNSIINFVIVAFAVFVLIHNLNRLKRAETPTPTTKDCPHCTSSLT